MPLPAISFALYPLLTLPWLNFLSAGPSPAVLPLLFSWICSLAMLGGGRVVWGFTLAAAGGAWLVAALISSAMGLLQYFGLSDYFSPWISSTAAGEAYANLRQRNQFATLTNIGLAALLWWAARQPKVGQLSPQGVPAAPLATPPFTPLLEPLPAAVRRIICMGAAALLAAGDAASSSRTGLVQLLLLLALAGLWAQWRRPAVRPLLWVAAMAYALASAALPQLAGLDAASTGILARLHDGGAACSSRLTLWGNVLHLISLKPWFGWGWGELDYAHFVTLYPGGPGARFCEILDNAHNLPLHLAVELGVPLALLVCGGGLWLAWRAKPWREGDATRQMAWSVLALIVLHSLLEYPLWYGPFQMAFGLCIGLLWCKPRVPNAVNINMENESSGVNKPIASALLTLVAMLLILFSSYAAWDYHRVSQIYLPPQDRSAAYRGNTLEKIQGTWLFQSQARFAELTITPLTLENAGHINQLARGLLHFSPEARVAERLIESARMLGRDDEAQYYATRYQVAFPAEYKLWDQKRLVHKSAVRP
jgi:O-antigen ligase